MKVSNVIITLGRSVSYFPGLKKITFSTTATILLCQFLYWTSHTSDPDGWFYKTSDELELETGLTYDEQATARKKLIELSLAEEKFVRSEHKIYFRVNTDTLNSKWDALEKQEVKKADEVKKAVEKIPIPIAKPAKKGDLVDAYIELIDMPGVKKAQIKLAIESKIAVKLNINPSGSRWEKFIGFAADRWIKDKQHIDKFIEYAILEGFNPVYWTPDKMQTLWPQAFINTPKSLTDDGFVVKSNDTKINNIEEDDTIAPMPKDLGRKY